MRQALALLLTAITAAGALAQTRTPEQAFEAHGAPHLAPMLIELIRFPTYKGNERAFTEQKAWLTRVATGFGFTVRDLGKVMEIDLPGPAGAPVLGLALHGDVVPANGAWAIPPFAGVVKDGVVHGRGAIDDKGPLVQSLLAMKALKDSDAVRTHTVRMIVGSEEETGSTEMREYLAAHAPPALTLVPDSMFPVVIGERAGNALRLDAAMTDRQPARFRVATLEAGLAGNIIPDHAAATLEASGPEPADAVAFRALEARLLAKPLLPGTQRLIRHTTSASGAGLVITVKGRAAHSGVNLEGGRNALVALANDLADELPEGGARDLLAFARLAGADLHGTGLGLTQVDAVFGRATAAPTLLQRQPDGRMRLTVNIRSNPVLSAEPLKLHLAGQVAAFNARHGASLEMTGPFTSKPLAYDPKAKLVRRLLAIYARTTGREDRPVVSGGATYAKSLPNAIAVGMWFPGRPYPGHDVDEQVSVADLQLGARVLLAILADLACSAPIGEPFKP